MKILLVAATSPEIKPVTDFLNENNFNKKTSVECLVTGIGMVNTTLFLASYLAENKIDLAINCGIAGTFTKKIKSGEVVNVITETYGDFGVEDDKKFLDIFETGLLQENFQPFSKGKLHLHSLHLPSIKKIKQVSGLTVNKVHGNEKSIEQIVKKYKPDIESMEGAAFAQVCLTFGIPCIEIRCISNFIERRNRKNWKIELAIKNLNLFLEAMLNEFSAQIK